MIKIQDVKLLGSWPEVRQVPEFNLPELALIGRSNVGKSSLINTILNRKAFAKVSATPGKTRLAVLFEVDLLVELEGLQQKRKVILVDLPGYGYAKVGKQQSLDFKDLIVAYLKKRKGLRSAFLLNDCRRTPSEDELFIWDLMGAQGLRKGLVLTKTDKLSRSEVASSRKSIGQHFADMEQFVISGTKDDKNIIREQVFSLVL